MLPGCVEWPDELAEHYREVGYWDGTVLGDILHPHLETDGYRPAVVSRTRTLTYSELDAWCDRLAAGFAATGVGPRDRVVVQLPNTPEFIATCIALFKIGAIPVLALPAHRRSEIEYLVRFTEAVALVIPGRHHGADYRRMARDVRRACDGPGLVVVADTDAEEFVSLAELEHPVAALPSIDSGEVALLLLSGGTTGMPKLIPRTHNDYAYQMRTTAAELGLSVDGAYVAALPAAHNAALACPGVLGTLCAGGLVALCGTPSPDEVFPVLRDLSTDRSVLVTTLMPALLPVWADVADLYELDLSKLIVEVGGAPLDPAAARRAEKALGCKLTRWFGMAEGFLSFTRPHESAEVRQGCEGRPLSPADEVRVVDPRGEAVTDGEPGELLVRGPTTIRGYYRADDNAETFTADGFLRTGDLVVIRQDGGLVVKGRTKDTINRGGEKISAAEVETHLRTHPAVKDVAVTGVADPVLGERVCAFVVAGETRPALLELKAHLRDRGLADYKLPERLQVVPQLPLTAVGKVDKSALRGSLERDGGSQEVA